MKLPAALAAALLSSLVPSAQPFPTAVTVPITLDHNRTIIDVYLPLPDGKSKRVRAWVDNGNPELTITQALAQKLGLQLSQDPATTKPGAAVPTAAPTSLQIGDMTISLAAAKDAKALLQRESVAPGCSAEITIPSTVLRNYDVLFDYPNRQFTIGPPGSISFKGESSKAILNPQTGLIQIASTVEGKPYNIALDLGSSISLLSDEVIAEWQKIHNAWPHMTGAIAAANMWGADDEPQHNLLRIPSLQLGATNLTNVAVAALPRQSMKFFADRAGLATIGLIGANALLNDRVGLDYAHSTIYLQASSPSTLPAFDVVGVILRPEPDGRYTILGTAEYQGKPSVPDVKAGDLLLGVDGAPATGATMGQVWSLLGGAPGQTRTLTLEREGKRFTVDAPVRRFLPTTPGTPMQSPRRNPHRSN